MEKFYEIAGAIIAFLFIAVLFLLVVWMLITIVGLIKDGIEDLKEKR